MPTYEYKCLGCGRRFDVFQSMSAEPLTECEECHGKLKRLVGPGAGFIFKGSGFYATDYRSDSYRQAAKSEKANASASNTKSKVSQANGSGKNASSDGKTASGGASKKNESTTKSASTEGVKT